VKPLGIVAIGAGSDNIWAMPKCKRCDDTEWVCENHPDRPWDRRNPRGCAEPALLAEIAIRCITNTRHR